MRTHVRRALLAVTTVLVTGASLPTSGATAATTCEPATQVVDATDGSWAAELGPAGHVVTRLWQSSTSTYLETVHAPDGTATDIVDGDHETWGAADVNRRGVVAGTQHYTAETGVSLYQPWIFRHGRIRDLADPGKLGHEARQDYYALAVNGRSAVVGLKTNRLRFTATDPEYVARPVLWPSPRSTPIKLDLPDGYYVDLSLLDLLSDGTVTGILRDTDGRRHLALWVTPGADPDLQRLPDDWTPRALAGQWVIGNIGPPSGRVFVRSWTESFIIDGPQPLYVTRVGSNGTFTVAWADESQTPTAFLGDRTGVHELGYDVSVSGLTGAPQGHVLGQRGDGSIERVTCALGLPEASGFEITELAPTKERP